MLQIWLNCDFIKNIPFHMTTAVTVFFSRMFVVCIVFTFVSIETVTSNYVSKLLVIELNFIVMERGHECKHDICQNTMFYIIVYYFITQ